MSLAANTIGVLATALVCVALAATPAQAVPPVTYNVNSTLDASDVSPGDEVCDSSTQLPGNQCTLRAAVEDANSLDTAETQTINLPAGDYALSLGPIVISSSTNLLGASARTTVVRQTAVARVFQVNFSTVSIDGVTVRGGTANSTNDFFGGNVDAQFATLTISRSTITAGSGSSGGGISNRSGTLTVRGSTITGNAADTGGGDGGAILNVGDAQQPAGLTVENSTISGNSARLGGGIISRGHTGNLVTIKDSTIASNSSGNRGGGGGLLVAQGIGSFENTIVAQNTSTATPLTPNCSADPGAVLRTLGFNLESGTDCAFKGQGDIQATDPRLGPLQNAGGPTDTRPLLPGSPAIDVGSTANCPSTDQRGVGRPQGSGCDIGAYEAVLIPETVIVSGPPPTTRDRTPTFTFTSSRPGTTFECSIDGAPFAPCTSPFTAPTLRAGTHTFVVRSRDAFGNVDPTPAALSFDIPDELADLPAPVIGKTVNAEPVSGSVLVAVPRGASASGVARVAQKGLTFVPLQEARQIPIGSFFNTRKGTVRLQSATTRRGKRQAGAFSGGLFQTLQSGKRSAKGVFELRLKGSSFSGCVTRTKKAGAGGARGVVRGAAAGGADELASASARSKRTIRRLRGNATGRFRTRGRYSAATVRGTVWTVTDRCDGTVTKVSRGRVAVRDFRRRKDVLVGRGKSYLARAPR